MLGVDVNRKFFKSLQTRHRMSTARVPAKRFYTRCVHEVKVVMGCQSRLGGQNGVVYAHWLQAFWGVGRNFWGVGRKPEAAQKTKATKSGKPEAAQKARPTKSGKPEAAQKAKA